MRIEMCHEFYYRIQNEDIYTIFNTSKENVLRNNNSIKHYQGEWVKIKLNDFHLHTVKPMETIKSISERYNINELELKEDNKLSTDKLFIGQRLKISKK